MSIDVNPTCPIIKRFSEDRKLSGRRLGLSSLTAGRCENSWSTFSMTPDQATEDQLRQYFLFVTDHTSWSSSTVNVTLQAL